MNLLFHQSAFGDFVLTFPILRALTGTTAVIAPWSKAQLAGAVVPGVRALDIESREFVDLHVKQSSHPLDPRLAMADKVISFVSDGHNVWADNIRLYTPLAHHLFIPVKPPDDYAGHVVDFYAKQLHMSLDQKLEVMSNRKGPVIVHPGSGGREKCWPLDRFEHLIESLDSPVRVVIGEVEAEQWDAKTLARWRDAYDVVQCATPLDLHGELREAKQYIGNDSGPTHLAAQLGLPTVAMFGPSDSARWGPRGPAVTILAPDEPCEMDWLSVEQVVRAAT